MRSRYDVILNGKSLQQLDERLQVIDIQHRGATITDEQYTVAYRHGARLGRRSIGSVGVTVQFEIHEYSTQMRANLCDLVGRWAKAGGDLRVSDRPGKQLLCVCSAYPVIGSAMKWTARLSCEFTAYTIPAWREINPARKTLTGTSANGQLYVPGNLDEIPVEVSIRANAAVGSVTLGVNGRQMTLSELNLSTGDEVMIDYDDELIQRIRKNGVSILERRSGVDDLLANGGELNAITLTADGAVDATFSARGWWA